MRYLPGHGRFTAVSVAWTTDRRGAAVSYDSRGRKVAMTNPARSRKQSLECLRLESECKALAARAGNPALRSHFARLAQVWNGLAHRDTGALTAVETSASKTCAA